MIATPQPHPPSHPTHTTLTFPNTLTHAPHTQPQEGGHAVDAAVAAALCQGVVNPFASGAGGGFFALLRDGASGAAEFVNAREVAPAAAYADMYSGACGGWGGVGWGGGIVDISPQ